MDIKVKGISVFIPVYNDEKTIGRIITDAVSVLERLNIDYEIIVVDDGSKDATAGIVNDLAKRNKMIKLIRHGNNRDYGSAIRSGFAAAGKEWVFYTDGDGQYDIKEITDLLPYAGDFDLINGYIVKRNDPLYRVFTGKAYQFLIDIIFGKTLIYTNCDFRLIKKEIMDRITINSNSGFAPTEFVTKLIRNGASVKQVAVSHFPRMYGRSSFFRLNKIINLSFDLLRFMFER